MLPVSNDRAAVVVQKGKSHHAICRFVISQSSQFSSPVVRASAAKVEGPGFKSRLGQHFSKVWHGLIDVWHPGTMHSAKGWYDSVLLCCKIYARQDVLIASCQFSVDDVL